MNATLRRLHVHLAPVRARFRRRHVLRGLHVGVVASAVICLLAALSRWVSAGSAPTPALVLAAVIGPPLVGAIFGGCWRCAWQSAAAAVDRTFGLKDRASTALQFAQGTTLSELQQMQIRDAEQHLQTVNPVEAVPLWVPWSLCGWLCVILCACGLWRSTAAAAVPERPPAVSQGIVEATEHIRQDLAAMEQLVQQADLQELQPLLQQLREHLQQLNHPEIQPRAALAAISEMQQALAAFQAGDRLPVWNARLQELGEALSAVDAWESASSALQRQEFETAARALEKARTRGISDEQARAAEDKLRQVADAMREAGMSELQEQVTDLADSLAAQDQSSLQDSSRSLARSLDRHQRLQDVSEVLQAQLDRLADYKAMARRPDSPLESSDGADDANPSNDSPVAAAGAGASGAAGSLGASGQGGRNAGATHVDHVEGRQSLLESQRQIARLTGRLSDEGTLQTETVAVQEAHQEAQRTPQQIVADYQRRSERAVQSEKIPLGHRETIRRYFESLRQIAGSADSVDASNPQTP